MGCVDVHDGRQQTRRSVHCCWKEDPIQEPDIVSVPAKPEKNASKGSNEAERARNPQETNVGEAVDDSMRYCIRVVVIGVLESRGVFEAREGTRDEQETSQQDPGEDAGEDVVDSWDLVKVKKHFHVPGLGGRYSGKRRPT